jgi:hypothetical protein
MTTVLEEYSTEDQRSGVRVFGQNDSMQGIFINKYFLFTARSVFSRKTVHNWADKFSQGRSKIADEARQARLVEIAT